MTSLNIRVDAGLKLRIARLAKEAGRTQNSLMVEALEQMADALEVQSALARFAVARDQAM